MNPNRPLSGATIWLTGLSGAGKSTLANAIAAELIHRGAAPRVLDGDALREGLNSDLGFSAAARDENVRRLGEVARLFAESGHVSIVAAISPYRSARERARRTHTEAGLTFLEVFVDTPLVICERRDPKGLYARFRAGDFAGLTGVDAPYERPENADLVIAGEADVASSVDCVVELLLGLRGRGEQGMPQGG